MHRYVHYRKIQKQPVDGWIGKDDVGGVCVCLHGMLLSHKKNTILWSATTKTLNVLILYYMKYVRWRRTSTIWFHSYVELKKNKQVNKRNKAELNP